MQITRSSLDTTPGPATGSASHTHPLGQTIYVTEGAVGVCQRRGGQIETIRPGARPRAAS